MEKKCKNCKGCRLYAIIGEDESEDCKYFTPKE